MNSDLEFHIRQSYTWVKLPQNLKQQLGHDLKEYDKSVLQYSIKNQLRFKDNLIHKVFRGERKYYEELLKFSRKNLMLYPYHLQDVMIKGLRTTPFAYYVDILHDLMASDRSYDCLPNFTAADCLRLLGIGRNQYIELMNKCRGSGILGVGSIGSAKRLLGVGLTRLRRSIRDLLPVRPVDTVGVDDWWIVRVGWVTEEDMKGVPQTEKKMIDHLIDTGACRAGVLNYPVLKHLYQRGLVYLEVPILESDFIVVPTLEGFVMNRVTGDYLETLLYKIFVSIDEHTSVGELSSVLQIDLDQVKFAISMFCRLGFAYKKPPVHMPADGVDVDGDAKSEESANHPSWKSVIENAKQNKKQTSGPTLLGWSNEISITESTSLLDIQTDQLPSAEASTDICLVSESKSMPSLSLASLTPLGSPHGHKLGFLFDSTLTAYLMMGNLSPGLKNHAVTMFEAGKLNDELVDNFLAELDRVSDVGEGEARRYFEHAVNLRETIRHLRRNPELVTEEGVHFGLDLLRCASLLGLEPSTRSRILSKNYQLLVSMAPLSYEDGTVSSCSPIHLGPPIPEVNSVWFKLFLYHLTGSGPPSLLLAKGSRLRHLPDIFHEYDRLIITTWNHDAALAPAGNVILTVNDALIHNPVLIQGYDGVLGERCKSYIPFPLVETTDTTICNLPVVRKLIDELQLDHTCGFITFLQNKSTDTTDNVGCDGVEVSAAADPVLLDLNFGVPLFSGKLNSQVCDGIVRNQLHSETNQPIILRAYRMLVLRLLTFLSSINARDGEAATGNRSDVEVPLPTRNFFFNNGQLSPYYL